MNTVSPVISIKGVSKAFSGVRALDNVQIELFPGEVHALMGENGAGKSTLMKILAGVYQKDSGEILLDGKEVDIDSPHSAQKHGISIIHQELNLMNHLSAAQNIFIGREPKHMGVFVDENTLNRKAEEIFARMHLKLDPRTPVGELTVAKQQMVEIAKALSFDSRVLIMDEPTAALNNAEVADLFAIIRKLKSHGVAVVYISHKMDELQQIADRVTVMRDGQYVATVPMATTSTDRIINMMVGRDIGDVANHTPDTSGNPVVLEVRDLNRGKAIRGVNFTLRKGEILGFAGLMGAGRTEVARAIFGADRIDSGEFHVHGQRAHIRSPEDAVAHGIGYLSEDRKQFGLATGLDVETNIVMSSLKRFLKYGTVVDEKRTRAVARDYVKQLKIKTSSVEKQVKLLSGGNQQKIVIAKWLLRDCDILFFDEPTRGIDIGAKSEIYKLLDALAEQGKAIVMISSELPEVIRMSHRILVMCEGRITGEIPGREATQENIMQLATRRDTETVA
ncbi:ribose transport system ATP-binding protein [Variovorax sp. HW608]|uniref:sugar ABC transporter ATP-binding protein n=1 Tax=Variovorax sp. HW608 TaxID=1034889 RepID=UPI00081F76DD|nr:sugar ABC transporter ATP-binding protein [Variovorax sp. HW608]SCK28818.1 ribose transport system ATP-binding protein [Variovorax sp. HW608]